MAGRWWVVAALLVCACPACDCSGVRLEGDFGDAEGTAAGDDGAPGDLSDTPEDGTDVPDPEAESEGAVDDDGTVDPDGADGDADNADGDDASADEADADEDASGCPDVDRAMTEPCDGPADCPAGARCLDEGTYGDVFPGGLCLADDCDLPGHECPEGSSCADLGGPEEPYWGCVVPCTAGSEPGDPCYACRDAGTIGAPDAGDYACRPVQGVEFWLDEAPDDGFCFDGNFTAGDGALGSACLWSSECASPFGLGRCVSLGDVPPLFCTIDCNLKLAGDGLCGGAEPDTLRATGGCWFGLCWSACDGPGGALGSNGCPQPRLACYPSAELTAPVGFVDGADPPLGLCFTACIGDVWCADMFGSGSSCDPTSGVCS